MSSLQANSQGDLALGSVIAATPAYGLNRGFAATITDNGVGDLSLTLSDAQALATQGICMVTPQGSIPTIVAVQIVSSTVLRVRTFTATVVPAIAAADVDYWIRVTSVTAS